MLKNIKIALWGSKDDHPEKIGDVQLASAAILVEAALMDGHLDEDEEVLIGDLLRERFGLDGDEAAKLFDLAKSKAEDSIELYTFTKEIKDAFDHDERVELIEMLWEVAYADGVIHDYEANLIRRVCGLIYVSDPESGIAKKRAMKTLGIA